MIHHSTCPLCSAEQISHFHSCNDHFVSGEVFNLCKCQNCGFIFTQDAPEETEAGFYYDSDNYISHSDSNKGIVDKTYQLIRRLMLYRKMNLIRRETGLASGSILDIGSGTGHFLNTMKSAGWSTNGIEINDKAREYSSTKFNIKTCTPEEKETLPQLSFDCITLWHVLEHFYEPDRYMEDIARLVKQNGTVIIALPNCNSFDAKYYGKKWAAWDVPRHLWHFNQTTFSFFALKNKFSIIGKQYLPFDVFYISILSEKYKGSHFPLLSGAFNGLRFTFRTVFNKSGSSSVIYILRKADS